VRPEGHPDRVECESEAAGILIWDCTLGGTLVVNEANRMQARCDGGLAIRVCDQFQEICAGVNQ
jgi:hypothetical protein